MGVEQVHEVGQGRGPTLAPCLDQGVTGARVVPREERGSGLLERVGGVLHGACVSWPVPISGTIPRMLLRRLPLLVSLFALTTAGCRTEAKPDGSGDPPVGDDSTDGEDFDGDGYATTAAGGDDCDDANAAVNPGVVEVAYDGLDNDCNPETPDDDLDGDGYALSVDCADEDGSINPGMIEVCDGLDNDCDGTVDNAADAPTWYHDIDGDGYGDDLDSATVCEAPDGYVGIAGDCDDLDAAYHPDADESDCADPNDYNCDGSVGYADGDGDGFPACQDCDDSVDTTSPNGIEACNGLDDDCDGTIDDYATDAPTWYEDADADTYGLDASTLTQCDQPAGYVSDPGDCDDSNAAYNPAASESCSDPNDYNCDGSVGYADTDADGFAACDECDDTDGAVNPSASEVCNGVDDDCDGVIDGSGASGATTWYLDLDADGYGDDATAVIDCDAPAYHVATGGDCDDHNDNISPDGAEVCDGEDNDCNSEIDEAGGTDLYYTDGDGDGYGDGSTGAAACDPPVGSVVAGTDCDDADAAYHPDAAEACTDTVDYNCDGSIGMVDTDGDGWAACLECDDGDGSVNPDASEVCNGVDDDCNGSADDGASDMSTWYEDGDLDGYGSTNTVTECDAPAGYIATSGDCDDANRRVSPSASEVCDGVDNDCDGLTDDASSAGALDWFRDADGDGYGDSSDLVVQCDAPVGYVGNATDCDDTDAAVYPAAPEDCLDAADMNCDGAAGYVDADGDGYAACEECDDSSADSYPGAAEMCDNLDNDCNGSVDDSAIDATTWYEDSDTDGYGSTVSQDACDEPSGYTSGSGDCDDSNRSVNPSAAEICDTIDNDCDGATDGADASGAANWYADTDADGYGDVSVSAVSCAAPSGYVGNATDCEDTVTAVNPGALEICDDVDNDCDGTTDGADAYDASSWHADSDGDGFGDSSSSIRDCSAPAGALADSSDCDDHQALINPDATEVCDSFDNDCDGTVDGAASTDAVAWYSDIDGDGYGDASTVVVDCAAPAGSITDGTDCDDADAGTYPGAVEHCGGPDHDCDGVAPPAQCANCFEILDAGRSTGDGVYTIEPVGAGSEVDVWCDMTSDGGGWTMVQRTVWDWADSSLLQTDYATWYGSTLGSADAGSAFRLSGQYWDDIDSGLEHMLTHVPRDAATGEDCAPLYYVGSDGTLTITETAASLSSIYSTVYFTNATDLSTTDSGPSTTCVNDYDADPWFYSYCCTTCPTFGGGYWTDEAHPMASYISDTADVNGNIDVDVCPSGAAVTSSNYEGVNVMEYYLR